PSSRDPGFVHRKVLDLALTYSNQRRWKEAKGLQIQVLKTRKITRRENHLCTLMGMVNLASTYSNQGQWAEAKKNNILVFEARKTRLERDHPSTLRSSGTLALTHRKLGNGRRLRTLKCGIADSPTEAWLSKYANLARAFWSQGRCAEAENFLTLVFDKINSNFGMDHFNTLTSVDNLASTYSNSVGEG
ncbi:kinesin light chain 1, partial [Penicillium sp. IBT 16267x]